MSHASVPRLLSVLLFAVLVGCSGPAAPSVASIGASASAQASSARGLVLVAIGDSIPYNLSSDCPGCTGFVDSYAATLETNTGQSVSVLNRSRHDGAQASDILLQLQTDQSLLAELATADVVVMSVGFNDQPPFTDDHAACPRKVSDSANTATVFAAAAATTPTCIETVVPVIRDEVSEVLARTRDAAPTAAIAVLTAYDTWRGWSEVEATDATTREALYSAETYWFHAWRSALCEAATAVDATCVDVYTAFNGADGTGSPKAFVGDDFTHPSQAGNDVIRDLLVDANLLPS